MLRVPSKFSQSGKVERYFFPTRRAAQDEKTRLEESIAEHGRGAAISQDERLALSMARKEGLSADQLLDAIRRFKDTPMAENAVRVSDLIDLFLKFHAEVKRSGLRHRSTLKSRLASFAAKHGAYSSDAIGPETITRYLDAIPDQQSRLNHYLSLSGFFNFAIERGHIGQHPMKVPNRIVQRPTVEYRPPDILKESEAVDMLEAAEGVNRVVLALGCFAGIRSCEMVPPGWKRPVLEWSDFDWKEGTIHIRREVAKKTRKRDNERWVPITDALRAWIEPMAKKSGRVVDCPIREFYAGRGKLVEAAGLKEWPDNAPRHSYASYFLAAYPEKGAAALAQNMGNSETVARQHYIRALKRTDGEAWFALRPK